VVWAAGAEGTDLSGLVGMVVQVGIMGLTLGMVGKLMKGLTAPRERPRLYGPRGELLPQTGSKLSRDERVRFIGACKVSDSLCLTHEQPVSRERRCPRSELTDEEWGMVWDVALEAFPDGQPNPWVNGWWPPTREEAERVAWAYEQRMQEATARYAQRMYAAAEMYRRSVDRAVYQYRRYVLGEYERGKELSAVSPRLIGPIERRELPEELEFFADSREQILASTDPHRQEMDRAFREAIERVRTGVSALKLFRELKG